MSQYSDMISVLPAMLHKYDYSKHAAIVETYSQTLDEVWDDMQDDAQIRELLTSGLGFSAEGDEEIKRQLVVHGV